MAIVIESRSDSVAARRDLAALEASLGNIEGVVSKVTNKFASMTSILTATAGLALSIKSYTNMNDALVNTKNRLRVVTDGQDELNLALKDTRKIAVGSRADLASVINLYSKVHSAGQRFNVTQQQSAKFTELVAKSIKVSGANAIEASSALLQLGQGLGANNLSGDELKSLSEATPALVRTIERGMGVASGSLKALGAEGKLTFDVIFNAINSQADQIENSFGRLEVTYTDAFKNIGNATDVLFANISNFVSGERESFAAVINRGAESLFEFATNIEETLLGVKSFFVGTFLSIAAFLDGISLPMPFRNFFIDLDIIKAQVSGWVSDIDGYFAWLYDRIIGHSWIPDIVDGIVEWFGKLMGVPLKLVERFTGAVEFKFEQLSSVAVGVGAALLVGFLKLNGTLAPIKRVLLPLVGIFTAIAGLTFLKTGIVLGFDTAVTAKLAAFRNLAEATGISVETLANAIGGTLLGSILFINRGLLPTAATLLKISTLLGAIAAFKFIQIGVMAAVETSPDKPLSELIGNGVEKVLTKFKTAFTDVSEKLRSAFNAVIDNLSRKFGVARNSVAGAAGSIKDSVMAAFDQNIITRVIRKIINPNDMSEFGTVGSTATSKTDPKISLKDDIASLFPENLPFHIATGVVLAVTAALYTIFAAGPLRTTIMALFAGGATSFVIALSGNGRLSDYFTDVARSFLNVISRGITGLFSGNVINDPFGLLSTVAKLALFFSAGREALTKIAFEAISLPTSAATGANDFVSKFLLEKRIGSIKDKLVKIDTGDQAGALSKRVADSKAVIDSVTRNLAGASGPGGAPLSQSQISDAINSGNAKAFSGLEISQKRQLSEAILQTGNLKESAKQLKELPHVVNELRDNKKILNTQLVALKTKIQENTTQMISTISNRFAAAGGIIGGVAGLQKGTEIADKLVDATPLQKMFVVIGFSAIGQLVGAAIGAVLVQALLLFFRGAFLAVVKAPFITGAILLAGALYQGYLLFKTLPNDWKSSLTGLFTRDKLVEGAVGAKSQITQRLEYRDRLKSSLTDPELTAKQLERVRSEILIQEKEILSLDKDLADYMKKNNATFLEKLPGTGGLTPNTELQIRRLKNQRADSKPLSLFPEAVASGLNNTTSSTAAVDLKSAYKFPTQTEIGASPGQASESIKSTLERSGDFFKQSVGQLSEAAQELSKTFVSSSNGTFAQIKKSENLSSGLELLSKKLADINVKTSTKALGGLSAKEIESLADAVDRVKDFSGKAQKFPKGSFTEKAALDIAREWRETIRGVLTKDTGSSFMLPTSEGGIGGTGDKAGRAANSQVQTLTVADQLSIINEAFPKLEYTLEEFRNSTDAVRESIFKQASGIFQSSKALDSVDIGELGKEKAVQVFEARKAIEAGRRAAFDTIQGEIDKFRDKFSSISQNLGKLGVSLRLEVFNQLTDTQLGILDSLYAGAGDSLKTLDANKGSAKEVTKLRNEAQMKIDTAVKEIDLVLRDVGKTVYERTRDALSRFNIFIQEQVTNLSTDAERGRLELFTTSLVDASKDLDSKDENVRLAAANLIDRTSSIIDDFIFRKANTVNDASRSIGISYLNNLNTGVQSAFSGLLRGDSSNGGVFKTFALSLLNSFSNAVIENFTKGISDILFGNNGLFVDITKRAGELLYTLPGKLTNVSAFSSAFDNSGSRVLKPDFGVDVGDAVKGVSEAVDASTAVQSFGFKSLSNSFTSGLTALTSGLGSIFTGIMGLFGGGGGGIGGILLNGVLGVLGAAGGLSGGGGGASAGYAKAASVFKYFASGGLITGEGSGTSDSILAMVSNREFIVNAASTKKFLPLLENINAGKLPKFATGGLVGSNSMTVTPTFDSMPKAASGRNSGSNQEINLSVTGDISRQTRREIMEMLPIIAAGTNRYNKEKGIRS